MALQRAVLAGAVPRRICVGARHCLVRSASSPPSQLRDDAFERMAAKDQTVDEAAIFACLVVLIRIREQERSEQPAESILGNGLAPERERVDQVSYGADVLDVVR
jgi:hypothetical protein